VLEQKVSETSKILIKNVLVLVKSCDIQQWLDLSHGFFYEKNVHNSQKMQRKIGIV
jgi:hypothetical protein